MSHYFVRRHSLERESRLQSCGKLLGGEALEKEPRALRLMGLGFAAEP
jgi:hypothetical protein